MKIDYRDLQDSAIQVADFAFLVTPYFFKRFVRLEELAAIEKRDSVPSTGRKVT